MSGRKRYNVLGAINAITHDLFYVCNETCINSLSVCDLLKIIRGKCENNTPITIIKHENKVELESLLQLNFQLYDNAIYS